MGDVTNKWISPRYRKVGGGAAIDESLFGKSSRETSRGRNAGVPAVDPKSASVIITASEIHRLKQAAIIRTEREEMDLKAQREA